MALITVDIGVENLGDVVAIFDQIEVHRSTFGVDGPFVEITDPAGPTAAQIDGVGVAPFVLDGLTLDVTVDGVAYAITFSGTDPLELSTVLAQIEAVVPGIATEVPTDTGKVRLTSPTKGTGSSILVTTSPASTELGLTTAKVNGKAARIPLFTPTSTVSRPPTSKTFVFRDLDGDPSYFYRVRFSSTTSAVVSKLSDPRQGSVGAVISSAALSTARISLVTGEGRPVACRRITFVPLHVGSVEGEYQVVPGFDARVFAVTNEQGVAEIDLLRGITYRVFFEGTSYARELVVPDVDDFDLLSEIGTAPDPFDIAQTVPKAIKVS